MNGIYLKGIPGLQLYLGCGKRVVLQLMSDGLPRIKINKRTVLFRSSEVDEFLEKYKEMADLKLIDRLLGG
ncbi:MAG: hypothetical protein J0665_19860 [Deltaproteobacteria bacterium]|jgi:predicted DNA-binding transcriptional regulator AlpA|nr:hypothetical protein [Deltaproteobacteria bacterium]